MGALISGRCRATSLDPSAADQMAVPPEWIDRARAPGPRYMLLQAVSRAPIVTLLERQDETARGAMSHSAPAPSDMPARACRPGSSTGATLQTLHVARDRRAERHGRPCMSPGVVERSDMVGLACRPGSSSGAT